MSEILGVLFAVLVGIMVIPKYTEYQTASNNNTRAAITAQQQTQIDAAATTYIKQNAVAIEAAATATTPVVLTVPMLQTAGLPTAFSATNPYGQTWQVEVLQPTAGDLQALSMSTGGTAVPDAQASKIASLVGATGGLIPKNDSGIFPGGAANAVGSYSGWTIPTANYTSVAGGHPAALLTFNNGQLVSNYLYRNAVPGQPQLNTMTTPLVMASVQTSGAACGATGAIAQDGTGAPLSCQGGVWTPPGGSKCVSTVADLNTIETDGRCYNGSGNPNSPAGADWFSMEVYRDVNSPSYYEIQRVMGMTGPSAGKVWQRTQQGAAAGTGWSLWLQQADPGVSVAAGTVTASNIVANRTGLLGYANVPGAYDVMAGRVAAGQAVYSYGNICAGNSSGDCSGTGGVNLSADGNTIAYGTTYNVSSGGWGFIGYDGAWNLNSAPTSYVGSAYLNDVYLRSVGQWASQRKTGVLRFGGQFEVEWLNNPYGAGNPAACWSGNPATGACTCPAGYGQQMVGLNWHYTMGDGAGFVCWGY